MFKLYSFTDTGIEELSRKDITSDDDGGIDNTAGSVATKNTDTDNTDVAPCKSSPSYQLPSEC